VVDDTTLYTLQHPTQESMDALAHWLLDNVLVADNYPTPWKMNWNVDPQGVFHEFIYEHDKLAHVIAITPGGLTENVSYNADGSYSIADAYAASKNGNPVSTITDHYDANSNLLQRAFDGTVNLGGAWRTGPGRVGNRNELASRQVALYRLPVPAGGD